MFEDIHFHHIHAKTQNKVLISERGRGMARERGKLEIWWIIAPQSIHA
jgi:hypothetical protein